MSDPRGFEPTERRDEPGEIVPDAAERQPADDQPDSGDYEVPDAETDAPAPQMASGASEPVCDRCGRTVVFDGPDAGTVGVTFSSPPVTRTLCAVCTLDEEKERQWRETGIWIGSDLPPSLGNARPATPDEIARLSGGADDERGR